MNALADEKVTVTEVDVLAIAPKTLILTDHAPTPMKKRFTTKEAFQNKIEKKIVRTLLCSICLTI